MAEKPLSERGAVMAGVIGRRARAFCSAQNPIAWPLLSGRLGRKAVLKARAKKRQLRSKPSSSEQSNRSKGLPRYVPGAKRKGRLAAALCIRHEGCNEIRSPALYPSSCGGTPHNQGRQIQAPSSPKSTAREPQNQG